MRREKHNKRSKLKTEKKYIRTLNACHISSLQSFSDSWSFGTTKWIFTSHSNWLSCVVITYYALITEITCEILVTDERETRRYIRIGALLIYCTNIGIKKFSKIWDTFYDVYHIFFFFIINYGITASDISLSQICDVQCAIVQYAVKKIWEQPVSYHIGGTIDI